MRKIAVALLVVLSLSISAIAERSEITAKMVTIRGVSYGSQIVCGEDKDGNLWTWYGSKIEVGQRYYILVDTRGTDDITDDSVIDAKPV